MLLVAIAEVVVSSETPQAKPGNAENELEAGIKLVSAGRYTESLEAFNRFKQSAPQDSRPYFYSGIALKEVGHLSAAALELQEAVRLSPRNREYRVLQASVLARLEQNQDAIEALATVDQKGSYKELDSAWLKLLAETHLELFRADDALRVLALLTDRTPKDPRVDFDRAKAYVQKGRLDPAVEAFKKSVDEEPAHNPSAYFELGKILYQKGDLEGSKTALVKAVEQDQNNPEYHFQLGVVSLAREEVDDAIGQLERAEPAAKAIPGVYLSLARAFRRKGDRSRAEAYDRKFQEANGAQHEREDNKRTADRLLAQGEHRLDEKNVAEARSLFEQGASTDPNRWEFHAYLAEILLDSEDLDRAFEHLAKMEAIDPDSVVGNYLMAKYWFGRKDFEQACSYGEWVRLRRPGNSELRGFVASVYEKLGRIEDAAREYEVAIQLAPGRTEFAEALQRILGRVDQGKPQAQGKVEKR